MNKMQHNPWLWSALKLAEITVYLHLHLHWTVRSFKTFSRETIELTCFGIGSVHTHHCTHLYLHVPRERVIKFNMRHWFFVGWWTLHHVRTVGIGVAHFETRLSFEPSKCCYSFDCRLTCGNMFAQHHS